ncbi:MAG: twin-arginine translocase subunit TatC [Myxococcota bacterium]
MTDGPTAGSEQGPEDEVEMEFFEHLGELRTRLRNAILGSLPAIGVAWFFKEELLDWLLQPLVEAWEALNLGKPQIHFANPIDPFVAYLKISIIVGLIASAPWLFWQLWAFIAPGLYRREKRLAVPFVLFSTVFFVGGVWFGYEVVFPLGFETFLSFAGLLPSESIAVSPTLMINEYLGFATRMLLAFGVVFEVPVINTFLSAVGLVTWRQLLAFARWWILIAAVLAAFLTPPDIASQLLMLVPLVALYFLSIGFAALFGIRHARQRSAEHEQAQSKGYER